MGRCSGYTSCLVAARDWIRGVWGACLHGVEGDDLSGGCEVVDDDEVLWVDDPCVVADGELVGHPYGVVGVSADVLLVEVAHRSVWVV